MYNAMARYHDRALAHYDRECMKCGMSNEEHNKINSRDLDVHHIDGDRSNDELDNLAVLCRGCHQKVHYGRDGYEDLHEQLPESRQWDTKEEWKQFRVPAEDYLDAKAQKEKHGRTWGEQVVRPDGEDTTDTQDVDAVIDELKTELSMAADPAVSPDVEGMIERLERIEAAVQTAEERTGRIESTLEGLQR